MVPMVLYALVGGSRRMSISTTSTIVALTGIEGMMYTMNVHNLQVEIMRRVAACDPKPRVLLVDVGGTAVTSITVMDAFAEMNKQLEVQGVSLWAATLSSRAATVLRRAPAWEYWELSGRLHRTVNPAVAAFEADSTSA